MGELHRDQPGSVDGAEHVAHHRRSKDYLPGGVPTQWAKLVDLPEAQNADFSHLRLGLVATAPASPELIEKVTALIGCPLIVRYAMTESPSITGTELDDDPTVLYHTVGRPQEGISSTGMER